MKINYRFTKFFLFFFSFGMFFCSESASASVDISASPAVVIKDQETTLSWVIYGASGNSCELFKNYTLWKTVPLADASTVDSPTIDTTYTIKCGVWGSPGSYQSDTIVVRVQESATAPCIPDNSCSLAICSGSSKTCTNNCGTTLSGSKTCSSGVNIVHFVGNPTLSVWYGGGTGLSWQTEGADYCKLNVSNQKFLPNQSIQISPSVDTTYQLTCYADTPTGEMSATKSVTVTVAPLPEPNQPYGPSIELLSINGIVGTPFLNSYLTVNPGGEVVITWYHSAMGQCVLGGSTNVTSLGFTGEAVENKGSKKYTLSTPGTYDFNMGCSKGSWSGQNVRVIVPPSGITVTNPTASIGSLGVLGGKASLPTSDPSLITSFTADQTSLSASGPVTLSWTISPSATACIASGGWDNLSFPPVSGSGVQTITKSTVFYLECWNAAGLTSGERTVQVLLSTPACTPNLTCAQNLCSGTTCPDGCGGDINGSQNCAVPGCVPNNSCADNKCTFDTCFNNCGTEISGKKQCDASTANTFCAQGTCQGVCDLSKEKKVGVCNNNTSSCCELLTPTTNIISTTPFSNPIAFNTVEGLLDSILGFLQASIVILSLIMIVIGSLIYMTAGGEASKLSTGKMIITASLVGLALALAAPSFLKEIGQILGWGATNSTAVSGSKTLLEILTNVLNFLLSVVGIIAIIMLVIGGLLYLLSGGDEDRMKQGKSIVVYSLIGITIALSALVLVNMVVGWFV